VCSKRIPKLHYDNPSGVQPPCKRSDGPLNSAAFFIHLLIAGLSVPLHDLHEMRWDNFFPRCKEKIQYALHVIIVVSTQKVDTRSVAISPPGSRAVGVVRLMLNCGVQRPG
jgi:hypothetical protein